MCIYAAKWQEGACTVLWEMNQTIAFERFQIWYKVTELFLSLSEPQPAAEKWNATGESK